MRLFFVLMMAVFSFGVSDGRSTGLSLEESQELVASYSSSPTIRKKRVVLPPYSLLLSEPTSREGRVFIAVPRNVLSACALFLRLRMLRL